MTVRRLTLFLTLPLVLALTATPAAAAPTDAAFNASTGALDVDYAGYLSKHDIVYNRHNTTPGNGLTVGNGRTGAMVWDQNGITAQVSGVDLAEQSTYAAGSGLASGNHTIRIVSRSTSVVIVDAFKVS